MNVRRIVTALCTAGVIASGIAVAPAAQAYDKDGYTYAAGHMIERSDIPKALGSYKAGLDFGAMPGDKTLYICSQPQSDPNADSVNVTVPGSVSIYNASYNGRTENSPFVSVSVNQYASATKAIRAFNLLKKRIATCDGTSAQSWSNDDGTTSTYSTLTTHGVVPSVTTAGVESLFLSINNLSENLPEGGANVSDSYSVYSLFGDTIIQTSYYSNSTTNLTTAQRKAVNQVAFNAETRWAS
jgi:hypothetical protein